MASGGFPAIHVASAEILSVFAFCWGGIKGHCRKEGGGLGTLLKSESPLSSPAASVLRRVVAPLTREREGLAPGSVSETQSLSVQPGRLTLLADNSRLG